MEISAYNEWGKLREVIVGKMEDDAIMAGWYEGMSFFPEKWQDVMKKFGGMKYFDAEPEMARTVKKQMDNLAKLLEERGIIVHRPGPLLPEEKSYLTDIQKGYGLYFPQDPILVIGNNIIETSLRFPVRRKEIYALRPILEPLLKEGGVKYAAMPKPSPCIDKGMFVEGGDLQFDGYDVYVGCSGLASNEAGIRWLQDFLGPEYRVHTIKLREDIIHLDGAFGLIRQDLGIMCPEFIAGELPKSLKKYEFIHVTEEEGHKLGGNVLCLDDHTLIIDEQHERIISELKKRGEEIITIPYAVTATYGGSVHCSTNCLRRDP